MPSWDPARYLKFSDHRLRPVRDLIMPLCEPAALWRKDAQPLRGGVAVVRGAKMTVS